MPLLGIAEFTEPYLLDRAYFDGTWIEQVPFSMEPAPGVWALPTEGGTDFLQRKFRGAEKPADYNKLRFNLTIRAGYQVMWQAVKRARSKARAFYFCSGVRWPDTFPATAGSEYRLSRDQAAGIVPDVSDLTHPAVIQLDGVDDPSAATIVGRDVTANASGELTIFYTPVHRVVIVSFPESITEHNSADLQVGLEEVLTS